MYLLRMCSSHANAFYHSLLIMVVFEMLTESLSIQHLVAHNCWEEFYQPVLVRIYRDSAIVEMWWLPFMTVEYVSSEH